VILVIGLSAHKSARGRVLSRCIQSGFTLIELLVVMAIVAMLASLIAPRYFESIDRAREAALRVNLKTLRDAIDKYHGDTGRYPESLMTLVEARFVRVVPTDPMTDSTETWVLIAHPGGSFAGVYDVRSGAEGTGRDGTKFSTW
jgi:general secretion pathway protein G